ncbi:anthranilate phosphoribosyltransferase [Malassezia pachydermatis]|uniref:Anthranilate phosphoribosyltransferase n=1 Tax=Malassezia pachydermatis TaxID=77020 RepID=A0A0M8MRZ6_9BASI|nr:anthranilate phosphoribosyltransferase [Malassezia pachydermatis]KOS13144.1 anthranilate phosphoribosyltransferase [Malassezia pachydermatis]
MSHSLATFKPLVSQLAQSIPVPAPPTGAMRPPSAPLSQDQIEKLLAHFADVDFTSNPAHHAAIGAALTSLRVSGIDREPSTLTFMRKKFLDQVIPVPTPTMEASPGTDYHGLVDLVGTGGDGKDTFNVSTTASFVAAGVEGMHVCKHGGKASSSTSGSAELLLSLGIPLLDVPAEKAAGLLGQSSCVFFCAPMFHRAMMPLAPIRASLGFPTLFNILGPLMNPARPQRGVYGVHSSGLGRVYAETLRLAGMEHFWVVCGQEGLDEISPAGPTDVWEVVRGEIVHQVITPADFGLPTHELDQVQSGSASQNAAVVMHMFSHPNDLPDAPLDAPLTVDGPVPTAKLEPIPTGTNLRAIFDYTVLQAAALLYVAGFGQGDKKVCAQLARDSITSGRALASLERMRTLMLNARPSAT